MKTLNRRSFIKNSSLTMAGIVFANSAFANTKINHRLSFSTLACPKWSLPDIINFAADNGYNGIEIRGILEEIDLTKCSDFSSVEKIASVRKTVEDKQLEIICLGASTQLHHSDPVKRKSHLDEAKRYIDLAQQLNSPYVRVFPDRLPKGEDRNATIDLIIQGLIDLADYAKGGKVSVLLEPHGNVVKIDDLFHIMENSENPHVGIVWDICNMWSITKEAPALAYEKLKKYIKHTHFRDMDNKDKDVLLGKGEVPISEVVNALEQGNYDGYYSLEWEKRWQPDIEEPEIALPNFSKEIKKYFKK